MRRKIDLAADDVASSEGSLVGDVRVKRLVVADGATFSGNVSMGSAQPKTEPEAEPKPKKR